MDIQKTYAVRAWTAAELVDAASVEAANLAEAMQKAEAFDWSTVAFGDPGDNQLDPHYLLVLNEESGEPEELSKDLSREANLKEECDRLSVTNAELLAALQACRPFMAYMQHYDRSRMTAGELNACDHAIHLTYPLLRKLKAL